MPESFHRESAKLSDFDIDKCLLVAKSGYPRIRIKVHLLKLEMELFEAKRERNQTLHLLRLRVFAFETK